MNSNTQHIPLLNSTQFPTQFYLPPQKDSSIEETDLSNYNFGSLDDLQRTPDDSMGDVPYKHVLKGIQELGPFSKLFFSRSNIDEIHRRIRYEVYIKTKTIISKQDEMELITIMRGNYLQYSMNPSNEIDFKKEIERLNTIVINNLLKGVVSNIQQYKGYLENISKNPTPLATPIFTSTTGTKTNRSVMDVLVGDSPN